MNALLSYLAKELQYIQQGEMTIKEWQKTFRPLPRMLFSSPLNEQMTMWELYTATSINFITISDDQLTAELLGEYDNYLRVAYIPGKNICGIKRMAFTVGLFYDIDNSSMGPRYCYKYMADAVDAFNNWDGNGHPPGPWIKHKGAGIDETNPNLLFTQQQNP